MRTTEVLSSYAVSVARLGGGMYTRALGPRPRQTLELFEFEACPFCRKVREALTVLDLEAKIYPCPKGGQRYRPQVAARGKESFPFLIDPSAGKELYESADIVDHLFAEYGKGRPPILLKSNATSFLGSAARPRAGSRARPSRVPERRLELWSFEASPYCRLVREALCELELPYLLHNVAKGSPSRAAFLSRSGRMMVPYLADPNTGRELFESADIVRYLDETYGE